MREAVERESTCAGSDVKMGLFGNQKTHCIYSRGNHTTVQTCVKQTTSKQMVSTQLLLWWEYIVVNAVIMAVI